ncbi:hypothetical protein MTP99_012913 [Tenebrio molitor]|nr:hypothetical protein MTP99_012913 [Tenebrio molitor]
MVVESSTTDDNTTTNKGVNVHSESLPVRVHRYVDTETSSSTNAASRSLADIRNEIQNVLDLMGPSTPNISCAYNMSSDADNETSVMSVVDGRQKRKSGSSSQRGRSIPTTVEISSSSERQSTYVPQPNSPTKDSLVADVGTLSTPDNFDTFEDTGHSCCDHCHFSTAPECLCMVRYVNQTSVPVVPSRTCDGYYSTPNKSTRTIAECKKKGIFEWLKSRSFDLMLKRSASNPCDLYKINISGQEDEGCPPKRVIFDLVEGIPKPTCSTVATNTIRNPIEKYKTTKDSSLRKGPDWSCTCKGKKNLTNESITQEQNNIQKNIYFDSDGNARVDYYYFDHGNAQYFHTTDTPPVMKCEILAEKTERYTTRFWAEFFASIHIGVAFCISFILQFFKFLLYSILRPLTVGLMQLASDYLFKPCLTTCFNGLIQPFLIFLYNIATSVRDLCDPIAEAFGYFCRELAVLFRAIRLCTYKKNTNDDVNCGCTKKYKCEC